jgi:serine/threonine protein kinase
MARQLIMSTIELTPGSIVQNRYRVLHPLGQGGMGKVFVVQDMRLANKTVALKALSLDAVPPAERTQALQDFQREAQILAALDHPGLTKVSDLFSEGPYWYIVMEFIPGRTLEALAQERGGRLPETDMLAWALQVCDVLDYLHRCQPPVIFRDLKPGNIILMPDGRLKLIDFGIARFFKPGQARDTRNMGTPGFAAPEQYGKGQTDGRSDVYSLGVTLHHLLTGYDPEQTPFTLPPARSLNADLSPGLEQVITCATQIQADQRYQTIADMRNALAAVIQGAAPETAAASRPSTAPRPKPFAQRRGSTPAAPAPTPAPSSATQKGAPPATIPTAVRAAQVHGGVRVSWQPPPDPTPSGPITGFLIIAKPSGQNVRAARFATEAIVTGLLPNLEYTFTVVAETSNGVGPPSAPSNTVQLGSVPIPKRSTTSKPAGPRGIRRANLWMTVVVMLLVSWLVDYTDLELTKFVSANGLPTYVVDLAFMTLMILPYYLTHRPGAVLLAFLLASVVDIAPGIGWEWLIYGCAAEGVLFMTWWRSRSVAAGVLAAAAGPIVAELIGYGPATMPDVLILAAGGALAAVLGNLIGLVTRIGR